jgi:hypothetical protein
VSAGYLLSSIENLVLKLGEREWKCEILMFELGGLHWGEIRYLHWKGAACSASLRPHSLGSN